MFLTFALRLAGGSVLPIFLLSILEVPLIGLVPLTLSPRDPTAGWRDRALSTLRALTQTYIWFGWAAYCALLAISYVLDPGVTQRWAYFATAFVALNGPIAFLAIRERMTIHSDEEGRRLEAGTTLYRGLTVVGFAVFCMAPPLMHLPYGWLIGRYEGAALEMASNAEDLMRMADLGIPRAQHTLGVRYRDGQGVPQDDTEALRLWRAAAEQGYDESQAQLCDVYAEGQGVPQDDHEAADWCARAAENGDAQASYHLGTLHARGRGVPQDRAEAARWYRIAAEHGVPRHKPPWVSRRSMATMVRSIWCRPTSG